MSTLKWPGQFQPNSSITGAKYLSNGSPYADLIYMCGKIPLKIIFSRIDLCNYMEKVLEIQHCFLNHN